MINELLFNKGKTYAVGLSGGEDSVCLFFDLIKYKEKLGINLVAINVEHGIRGQASIEDSEFVKKLCDDNNIDCLCYNVDAVSYAKLNGYSLEQSARILRYDCFFNAINNGKCDAVCLAHHKSDNIETILFNIFRGSSLKGVCGMSEVSYDGRIIRPFLNVSKQQIHNYSLENNLKFRVDLTNFDENYTRNNLRLSIIPKIKEVFPNMEDSVLRLASLCKVDDDFLNAIANNDIFVLDNCVKFKFNDADSVISRRIVFALNKLGITKDYEKCHIDSILKLKYSTVSTTIDLPFNLNATRDYDYISLYFKTKPFANVFVPFTIGQNFIGNETVLVEKTNFPSSDDLKNNYYIDYDKLPPDSVFRFRQEGDVFTKINGGTKKLGDYFTDKKILERDRNNIPLLASGKNVLFICNIAVSCLVKVDKDTKNVLQLSYIKN